MTNKSIDKTDEKIILKKTAECIFQQGIFNVELNEIAELCEVQVSEINDYFGGKDRLLLATAKEIMKLYKKRVCQLLIEEQSKEISGFEVLKNILEMKYNNFKQNYKSYFFINELIVYFSGKNENISVGVQEEFINIIFTNPLQTLEELIKAGIEDGSIRSDIDINATAKMICDLFVMGMEKASTSLSTIKGEKKKTFEEATLGGIAEFLEATLLYIKQDECNLQCPKNKILFKGE